DRQPAAVKVLLDQGGLEAPRRQSQKTPGSYHLPAPSQHHFVDVLLRLNPHRTQKILEGVQLAVQNPLANLRVNGKGTQHGEVRKRHLEGVSRKSIKRLPRQLIRHERGGEEKRATPPEQRQHEYQHR